MQDTVKKLHSRLESDMQFNKKSHPVHLMPVMWSHEIASAVEKLMPTVSRQLSNCTFDFNFLWLGKSTYWFDLSALNTCCCIMCLIIVVLPTLNACYWMLVTAYCVLTSFWFKIDCTLICMQYARDCTDFIGWSFLWYAHASHNTALV